MRINESGQYQPGYCKLCSVADPRMQDELDKRVGHRKANGDYAYSAKAINEWLVGQGTVSVARRTIYNHRRHVEHPQDRLVNAIAKRAREHGVQPAQTSHEEFLSSLVSLGQQRITDNPEEVTIDHALKAAKIQADKEKKGNTQNVLVQLFTNGGDTIEGEAREV